MEPSISDNPLYRCGIIGLGRVASLFEKDPLRGHPCTHAGLYRQHPQCRLIAGSDISPERRSDFSSDWNLNPGALYENYEEMLSQQQLDLVSICAYAPERLAMCKAALENGAKGLWIEKTLGCSLRDAIAIADEVEQHGAKAVVDYPRRARAPYRVIRRLIENETYGKLQSVTCHMNHQLLHTGTHAYDVLRFWAGEAVNIYGKLEHGFTNSEVVDQGGIAQIEMDSGTAVFISARKKKYYIFQFDLIFENARILIGNDIQKIYFPDQSMNYSGFKELFENSDFSWSDSHRENLLQDLITSIDQNTEPLCSVANAIEALKIGLGIFYSHLKGGVWISPVEIPVDLHVPNL